MFYHQLVSRVCIIVRLSRHPSYSLKIIDVIDHALQKFLIFFPVIFSLEYLFGHLLIFSKVFNPQRIEVLR